MKKGIGGTDDDEERSLIGGFYMVTHYTHSPTVPEQTTPRLGNSVVFGKCLFQAIMSC